MGIYDKLIANVMEMLQLPGTDEDDVSRAHYSARLLTFKARPLHSLARTPSRRGTAAVQPSILRPAAHAHARASDSATNTAPFVPPPQSLRCLYLGETFRSQSSWAEARPMHTNTLQGVSLCAA